MLLLVSRRLLGLGMFAAVLYGQAGGQQAAPSPQAQAATLPPGVYADIVTSMGRIVCRLLPDQAPKTVANFRGLVTGRKAWTDPRDQKVKHTPFYTGLTFHRVIKGFMIQGGDPLATGEGGPGYSIDDEVSPNSHFDKPGLLAMAKRSEPNTAGSQFFITTAPAPWLDGKYTIFGEVVEGQDVVDRISETPTDGEDKPTTPLTIQKITIRTVGATQPNASAGKAKPPLSK
jgi:peptidyl-prolyl cis-trans isomerase A (cyclophilin A)